MNQGLKIDFRSGLCLGLSPVLCRPERENQIINGRSQLRNSATVAGGPRIKRQAGASMPSAVEMRVLTSPRQIVYRN
jgi:hypothetical protein